MLMCDSLGSLLGSLSAHSLIAGLTEREEDNYSSGPRLSARSCIAMYTLGRGVWRTQYPIFHSVISLQKFPTDVTPPNACSSNIPNKRQNPIAEKMK